MGGGCNAWGFRLDLKQWHAKKPTPCCSRSSQALLIELVCVVCRVPCAACCVLNADDAGPDYRYPSWPALLGIGFGWWAYCRCVRMCCCRNAAYSVCETICRF